MENIAVIGAGKWGQALHFALSQKQKTLISSRTLRNIPNFVSLQDALNCEYLIIAISSQHIRLWLEENFVFKGQNILVASKGIEAKTGQFLNEIYSNFVPKENVGFISGPSFASEVLEALPTAIEISSENKTLYDEFSIFFPNSIKTYYNDDIAGAEIAGAYKNILAIASGICDGLGLGNNARASLIARGLVEMSRFGKFFGSKEETFLGLSGAGDLFLTASSEKSRNYRVGLSLAKNKNLDEILQELGEVAEGVATCFAVTNLAQKHNIYIPIANEVKQILEGKKPQDSMNDLLYKSNFL